MTAPDLHDFVTGALSAHLGRPCTVARLRRQPYAYSTSYALLALDAELSDGSVVPLVLKDLSEAALLGAARTTKPAFLYEPLREIETYRSLLSVQELGTATCFDIVADPATGRYWLLLERVSGRELWQVGELETWEHVARWLARLHTTIAADDAVQSNPHLLVYDAAFYRRWWERASGFAENTERQADVATVTAGLAVALERLSQMPVCFVHGEFYPSNVLVADTSDGPRICPVDWEMAGVGPALLDLAALTAGWDDEAAGRLVAGYRQVRGKGSSRNAETDFLLLLRCCRLYLAVQWIGWSQRWVAPPEHTRDWMGEAVELSEELLG